LGRGAAGAVYAARDSTTGAVVALKKLDAASLKQSEPNFAGSVLKQARSARQLRHRNVANTDDAGEAGGTVYIATEMLEGESLRKILDDGPLAIARAIQIAREIAGGLAYAHLQGMVHGRLKPSNVMILRSGAVKITDFGIGPLGHTALLSGPRTGSLSYMSPEQARGEAVDHRADLFSLGALFYEMLAHRPPFEGDSPKAVIENILHARPRPPSELNQHVPRALDTIVLRMLAKQPADRIPGAPILLRELERLEEGLGLGSGAIAASDAPAADAAPAPAAGAVQQRDPTTDRAAFDYQRVLMRRESRTKRSSRSRPAMLAGLAVVLAVLGVGVTKFTGLAGFTRPVRETPATAPAAALPSAPSPVAVAVKEPPIAPAAPQASPPRVVGDAQSETKSVASAQPASLVAPAPEQPAAPSAVPAQEPPPAVQATAAQVPAQQREGTARVVVAVSPGGEIYIDDKHYGTTPPITTFELQPGMHRIEVRSGSRKPYLTYMTVQPGDVRRIRHDFEAKPSRPPG
jgi:serine/threonine-protein kinase